jgi:transcriptional regulator with AAA-type ATPase domain
MPEVQPLSRRDCCHFRWNARLELVESAFGVMTKEDADTTVRARIPGQRGKGTRPLAVFWVYPTVDTTWHPLEHSRSLIGRGAECAIRLEGGMVSRVHAEVYREGPIFVVRDTGSTNGTYLNGCPLEHGALSSGDVLRVGSWVGVVARHPASGHSASLKDLGQGLWGGAYLSECVAPARLAAVASIPVLIAGETGTGKERLAQSIHAWSGRAGPLVCINCAALPPTLAEAELFGYRRGAFTGAERANPGYFRAADGGTVLLDEVSDLPLPVQAKLLRVLEEGVVTGLGETQPTRIDVRIVAAAQQPLAHLVEQGTFRADLFARLAGVCVKIPPLRERREDVVPLFRHFLGAHADAQPPDFDVCLAENLCLHAWPHNVRELQLLARQLLALHGHEHELGIQHLPLDFVRSPAEPSDTRHPNFATRREYDLHRLARALEGTRGNVKAAAEALGLSRARVYRLLDGRSAQELLAEHGTRSVESVRARGGNGAP